MKKNSHGAIPAPISLKPRTLAQAK